MFLAHGLVHEVTFAEPDDGSCSTPESSSWAASRKPSRPEYRQCTACQKQTLFFEYVDKLFSKPLVVLSSNLLRLTPERPGSREAPKISRFLSLFPLFKFCCDRKY